jgi:hypothetical protein
MSLSVSSNSQSGSSTSKVARDSGVDKKDKVDSNISKPQETVQEEPRAREERDTFEARSQPSRSNTLQAPEQANTFWDDTARNQDQAFQKEAKELWKSELGRDIPDAEAARLSQEAKDAGCLNEREARAHFQKMISGSAEKAALNHINAEFERNLGRSISVPEQQEWLKGSGLDLNSPSFAGDVTKTIQSSEEFRIRHPQAQSWADKAPIIDQLFPQGWQEFKTWDAKGERNIMQNGKANCGPTSAAMVGRALGFGEGKTDAQLVKELMRVGGTTAAGSSPAGVAAMIRHMGVDATVKNSPRDLAALDAALAEGKMVIANGDYHATGVPGRNGGDMSGHFCLVTGKDDQGNYLVNDPWGGDKLKFSPQAMLNYFKEHRVADGSRNGAMIIVEKPASAGAPAAAPAAAPAPAVGSQAPQGDYERAVAEAIANAPKDNKNLRPHWANFAADQVAPRLEALGVPRDQIKKAILWGLTEGTSTVGTNGKYRLENGAPSSSITYSNLGDNAEINRATQTPSGLKADGTPFTHWQVGIAGVQVKEAVQNGWLKDAFEKLYPGQTPQQVGQRMLDLMGETNDKTFPNLSIDQLTAMNGDTMVNGKWASILLRDPAINILAMTNHKGLDHWLGVNRNRLEQEAPGFYASLQNMVNQAFD